MSRITIIHPGEILEKDFIESMDSSFYKLSQTTGIPAPSLSLIAKGRRHITPDVACRLGAALKTTPEFWLNLQARYDLLVAQRDHGRFYRSIKPLEAVPA